MRQLIVWSNRIAVSVATQHSTEIIAICPKQSSCPLLKNLSFFLKCLIGCTNVSGMVSGLLSKHHDRAVRCKANKTLLGLERFLSNWKRRLLAAVYSTKCKSLLEKLLCQFSCGEAEGEGEHKKAVVHVNAVLLVQT